MSNPTVDLGRLIDYRLKGLSYQDIGDLVGLSPNSVMVRIKRHELLLKAGEDAANYEANQVNILKGYAGALVARGYECAIAESGSKDQLSGYQATGMFGIVFDKLRQLEGKSNFNVHVLSEIITRSEDTGDNALRKLSVDAVRVNKVSQFEDANVVHDSSTPK